MRTSVTLRLAGAVCAVLVVAQTPMLVGGGSASAATKPPTHGHWTKVSGKPAKTRNGRHAEIAAKRLSAFRLDRSGLRATLATSPRERSKAALRQPLVVSLPAPDGTLQRFTLADSPVMEAGLAAKHPEIKTYAGKGLDDPAARIRADLTPLGFHASVRSPLGAWYVDPYYRQDQTVYASYYGRDLIDRHGDFVEREDVAEAAHSLAVEVGAAADAPVGPEVTLRTYRLALVTDPTYATYFGAANVTAAKVTLVNRVSQIYEDEMAVRLLLIAGTDKTNLNTNALALGPNGPCGAAPCFPSDAAGVSQLARGCTEGLLNRNRIVLGQIVGASNYDIGHIGLGMNGGGVASVGVVGGNDKAQGCTGLPTPVGDFYAVDYVAHEMGHQFAGRHTFNGAELNCSGGSRNGVTSVEPGSGTSIMAYAGICGRDNTQAHSDPYFSQRSVQEVTAYITATRPAINEVQTVSLYGFAGSDSFRLSFNGKQTRLIRRGVNYSVAGITRALETSPGWPLAGVVTVAPFGGGTGAINNTGFQVTFGGTLGRRNQRSLSLTRLSGATGFVGETAKGGPIDNSGNTSVLTGNHAPVVTAAGNHVIPTRTPFALTGSATDSDGDSLTYMWEQNDRGGASGTALVDNLKVNGPLFRQFGTAAPVTPEGTLQTPSPGLNAVGTDPTRVFPDLMQILANNTNAMTGSCPAAPPPPSSGSASNVPLEIVDCYSEFLPTAAYLGFAGNAAPPALNFRLTVRDGHAGGGGIGSADSRLTLATTSGPFLVTSQDTSAALPAGSSQLVTWDVAGTNLPPVSTSAVRISLSKDGGLTYPYVLAATTANDGSESVALPQIVTSTARIKVEAVGNVYFDISAVDFTLADTTAPVVTVPADITVNAVHPAGTPASYSASATDAVDGPITPSCSPVSGSTFPIATTTVSCTATDASGNTGTATFTALVRGAAAQLQDLIAASTGVGRGRSLADKARATASRLARGSTAGVCSSLATYLRLLRAQDGKKIPAATAAALRADATRIRAVLAC